MRASVIPLDRLSLLSVVFVRHLTPQPQDRSNLLLKFICPDFVGRVGPPSSKKVVFWPELVKDLPDRLVDEVIDGSRLVIETWHRELVEI